jgi:hypothetical protein
MTGFATSRFALSSATNSIGANIKSIISGVACWDLQRPRQSWCRFRAWGRSWPRCSWAWALAWLVVQERRAQERIIPVALRRNRAIAGNFGSLTIGALLMCVVGFLPTYVHAVMGRSAAVAAFVVATLSVAWEYGSITAGRVVAKMSYRSNEAVGALTLIGGAALLITLDPNNCFAAMTTGALLIGIGMGICNLVFLLVVQGSVGWSEGASLTASTLFTRTIGQTIGAGMAGAILNFGISRRAPFDGRTRLEERNIAASNGKQRPQVQLRRVRTCGCSGREPLRGAWACRKPPDGQTGLANLRFGDWSRVGVGQINRKHYAFVVDDRIKFKDFSTGR